MSSDWEIINQDEWESVDEPVNVGLKAEEIGATPVMDMAEDVATAAHQALTLGFSDEMAGEVSALKEYLSGGDKKAVRVARDNTIQEWRGRGQDARERNPIAHTLTEMLTPSALDVATAGASKLGKIPKALDIISGPVSQGIAAGVGYSDESDEGVGAAIGGAGGLAGKLIGWGGRKLFDKPSAIRQRRLGASSKEFKQRGRLSPLNIDKHLDEIGFYKGSDEFLQEVNPETLKVVRTKEKLNGQNPVDNMITNSDKLISEYSDVVAKELDNLSMSEKSPFYNFHDFSMEPEISSEFSKIRTKARGNATVTDALDKAAEKIEKSFDSAGGEVSLVELNNLKREMQSLSEAALLEGGKPTPESKVFASLQSSVRELIERKANEIGGGAGKTIKMANENMSRLITQRDNLVRRYAKEMGGTMGVPFLSKAALAQKGATELGATPMAASAREAVGFAAERNPMLASFTSSGIKNLPRKAILSMGGLNGSSEFGDIMGQINSIPKMLAKTPIPRDSDAILENKEFVKAKIAMAAPTLLPYVEHALYEEPDKIEELLPMLIQMAPNMFERDVYNRIDGKIESSVDREKALQDTREDEMMTNTEKAKRAHSIALKRMV